MKMNVSIEEAIQEDSNAFRSATDRNKKKSRAVLLGKSGEKLKTFFLEKGDNELSFDEFAVGTYTLRIESGNEIIVRQIIIQ